MPTTDVRTDDVGSGVLDVVVDHRTPLPRLALSFEEGQGFHPVASIQQPQLVFVFRVFPENRRLDEPVLFDVFGKLL